jgi:Domain of Unknown Function (DUF1080)
MQTNRLLWIMALGLSLTVPGVIGRQFEEPSVMNLPYTQQVPDPYFGDYEGTYAPTELKEEAGGPAPMAAEAKVIPEGHHSYRIILAAKPREAQTLPWQIELVGRHEGERIVVEGQAGDHDWEGEITKQGLRINKRGYGGHFDMKRIIRKSPTEGLPPPADAIVLLAYPGWVCTDEGILHKHSGEGPRGDLSTKREFRNVHLHLEFRLPYEPDLREQSRGNSGVIFADRYEVQVLDSYGIFPGAGDCASIYDVAPPKVNAAFPPLSWQTYDITFYAAKLDGRKLVRPPKFTVLWNGVKVQDNQATPTPTGDPGRPNAEMGPLRLQDHGNLVYYRNIWIEELPDAPE